MRNLLALAAAALLTIAVVGHFRGWYRIQSDAAPGGHQQIHIDVNRPKISEDVNVSKTKLRDLLQTKETNAKPAPTGENQGGAFGVANSYHVAEDGTFVYPGSEQSEPPPPR